MMKKVYLVLICLLLAAAVWFATVISDRQQLNENVIRLHVVANSDSGEDQRVKLLVRDEINSQLATSMEELSTPEEALAYLREHLSQLEEAANAVLEEEGFPQRAVVTLQKEAFSTRHYDTFSLPAGVYNALRVTIGDGAGQNWWCVVFPRLCLPATSESFSDTAAGAGFQQPLTGALQQESGYEVRFFLLDWLGWLENFFFGNK